MSIPKTGPEPLVELEKFLEPFGRLVRRAESRHALERYATGLLSAAERKTASGLGRSLPGTNGQRLQEFLTRTAWDPREMDELRLRHMSTFAAVGDGILIVDDTGFAKKGTDSVGVARQYSGTLGRVDNCQVLVTAHYVDRVFDWPVTARLYLPESWASNRSLCRKAQVPRGTIFQTKGEIALDLIDRARKNGVPFRAVVADAGYGDQSSLLDGLVARGIPHVAGISRTTRFRLAEEVDQDPRDDPPPAYTGKGRPRKGKTIRDRVPAREASAILEGLPPQAWERTAWRDGTKGPLVKEFAKAEVFRCGYRGAPLPVRGWLLGERSCTGSRSEEDRKYFFLWGQVDRPLGEWVEMAHLRWVIERFYQDAKGELGLDHYEGRLWTGFHRHVALVMLAHSFLTLRQSYGPEILGVGETPIPPGGAGDATPPPPLRSFPPTGAQEHGLSAPDSP